jgi:2-dehydro-3-deoxyphosphooctonate aldolase (KDO 8-P synthase)
MIEIRDIKIGGNNPIVLIAGPCVVESEEIVFQTAEEIKKISTRLNIPYISNRVSRKQIEQT